LKKIELAALERDNFSSKSEIFREEKLLRKKGKLKPGWSITRTIILSRLEAKS
jgi:hypothetical protein